MLMMGLSFYIALGQTKPPQPDCSHNSQPYPIPSQKCNDLEPTGAAILGEKFTEEAQSVDYAKTEVAKPRPTITEITAEQRARATIFVPGTVPDTIQVVKPLDAQEADTPTIRYANSIWQIGGIPLSDSSYDYITVFALARPVRDGQPAEISIVPFSNSLTQGDWKQYFRVWQLPASIDRVTITGFDKLVVKTQNISGILHFKTLGGDTGDLNLASGDITISGLLVVVTPVASTPVVPSPLP